METTGSNDFQDAASKADLVVNFADGASLPIVQAIIAGLRERFEKTEVRPILIHISGSAAILDPTPFAQSGVTSVGLPVVLVGPNSHKHFSSICMKQQDTDEAKLRAISASRAPRALDVEFVSSLIILSSQPNMLYQSTRC